MILQGKIEHRNHSYTFEVALRDISENELLKGFFFKVKNEQGKIRSGVWFYEKDTLTDSLLQIIQQKKTLMED